ncbi:hypothetical protein [Paraburkholderia phenoliruptrix]|uniref:hypothetical protein n=2 Tax=Pseudomonadota TaxID=1224 RepID=UPI001C6F1F34|nr:hypothetical protein [Paraburkholderia phenoliruptrix]MBW9102781.1 hypothetical protein [Paraburkholderia phenoliruptrix]MBW9133371.1 hypothetical protein [Paraburkholderia ginsengiterrae]
MKAIINLFFFGIALVHASQAICGTALNVYAGAHGDAILIDAGKRKTLLVAGGAVPRGAGTASDCFAKATLSLKRKPDFYEGQLDSVHNEIIDVDPDAASGRLAGVYIYPSGIRIGNIEVDGICADGIDFSGDYKKVRQESAKYASAFAYFMRMEAQNAENIRKHDGRAAANDSLRPFIEADYAKLRLDIQDRKAVESILKKYKSMQRN